jgi:1-acyl-sn-glycerol-3-phosphate acyltransferase
MRPDLAPVKNYFFYWYCVFIKWVSFFIFGLGTVVIVTFVFPVMLLLGGKKEFRRRGHRLISFMFVLFTGFMFCCGIFKIVIDDKDRALLKNCKSKIIIANHPSLLDVVTLVSLIPNADCIVNAQLLRNIVSGVVRKLYIPNSLNHEELFASCAQSLYAGDCLIIFPEGTRTPRSGVNPVRKGAARLAIKNSCDIIPVHIGGSDKYGLGKKDPWYGFNPTGRYIYKLSVLPYISPVNHIGLPEPAAVKKLTEEIKGILFSALGG